MKLIGLALNRVSHVSQPLGPAITLLSVDDVTQHSAQISYAAGPVGATVYFYVSGSAMPPSEADLIAGTGADWSGSQGISNTPSGTPGPSGLAASTNYWLHAIVDDAGNRNAISTTSFTTAAADVTAPILSDQGVTVIDAAEAELAVTTDEAGGSLYVVVTTTQGTPSETQMRAGDDSTGSDGAYVNGGQAVAETGEQIISATGLTGTEHYAYFMQDDAAGNASNTLEAGPFTPADVTAPVVSSVEIVETGTTTATVSFNTDTDEGTGYVIVQPTGDTAPTQAEVVAGSVGTVQGMLAISAIGPQSLDIEGLSSATGYLAYVVHTDVAGNNSDVVVAPAEAVTQSNFAQSWTSDGGHDTFSETGGSFSSTGGGDVYSDAYIAGASGDTINVQLVFGAGTTASAVDVALSNNTNVRSTTSERIDPSGGGTFDVALEVGSGTSPYSIFVKTYGSTVELTSTELVFPSGNVTFTDELADGVGTPVALTSPSITGPYVFQRGRSNVTMSGTFDVTGGNVSGMAWRVGDGDWVAFQDEVIDNGAGTWSGTLATPSDYLKQGDLQIKPVNGLNVTPATIADVAVTAVIIASGQSNVDDASVDAIQSYTAGAFDYYQRETTQGWTKTTSDATMWPALAEELQAAGIPPAIYLPVDSPGTGYNDGTWVRDTGLLYSQFVDRVTSVTNQTGGVELNLRIQGEKETGSATDAPIWDDYFEDMRAGFVSEIPNMLATDPWFIGITYRSNPYLDDVQAAQMREIDENAWAYELLNVIGETFGDGVHYGSTGAITLAEAEEQMIRLAGRMYRNISPLLLGTGTPPGSPVVTGYAVSGNEVTVTFDRAMTNHADADGWTVTDDSGTRTVVSAAQGATAAQVVLTLDQETYGDVLVSFAKGSLAPNATLRDTAADYFPVRPIIDDLAGIGAGLVPTADAAPTLSGAPQVGIELSGTDGTYSGIPDPTVGSYQWQVSDDGATGWTDISGATSATYTPVAADGGKYVRREETATNAVGSVSQATSASGQIAAASAFTDPSDLAATQEWWDATDTASFTTYPDDRVSEWASQVGGIDLSQPGQSFAPEINARTINGLNVVYFDGSADDFDGFIRPSYLPEFQFASGSSSIFRGELVLADASDIMASAVDRSATGLWEIEFDATANTVTLRYNGTQIGQSTNYTGNETGHVFMIMEIETVDNANDRAIFTGATVNIGGASQYIDGSIGEIVLCDDVISGSDLTDMRSYFTNKWGVP